MYIFTISKIHLARSTIIGLAVATFIIAALLLLVPSSAPTLIYGGTGVVFGALVAFVGHQSLRDFGLDIVNRYDAQLLNAQHVRRDLEKVHRAFVDVLYRTVGPTEDGDLIGKIVKGLDQFDN